MKISIHMPAYNAEATIASALKSLLRQRDAGAARHRRRRRRLDRSHLRCRRRPGRDGAGDPTDQHPPRRHLEGEERGAARHGAGYGPRGLSGRRRPVADGAASPATCGAARPTRPSISSIRRSASSIARTPETLAPSPALAAVDGRVIQLGAGVYRRELLDRVSPFDESFMQAEDTDYLLRIFEQRPEICALG